MDLPSRASALWARRSKRSSARTCPSGFAGAPGSRRFARGPHPRHPRRTHPHAASSGIGADFKPAVTLRGAAPAETSHQSARPSFSGLSDWLRGSRKNQQLLLCRPDELGLVVHGGGRIDLLARRRLATPGASRTRERAASRCGDLVSEATTAKRLPSGDQVNDPWNTSRTPSTRAGTRLPGGAHERDGEELPLAGGKEPSWDRAASVPPARGKRDDVCPATGEGRGSSPPRPRFSAHL